MVNSKIAGALRVIYGVVVVLAISMIFLVFAGFLSDTANAAGWGKNKIIRCVINSKEYGEMTREQCNEERSTIKFLAAIDANKEAITALKDQAPATDCSAYTDWRFTQCNYHHYVMVDKLADVQAQTGNAALTMQDRSEQRAHEDKLHKRETIRSWATFGLNTYVALNGSNGRKSSGNGDIYINGSRGGGAGCAKAKSISDASGLCGTSTVGDTQVTLNIGDHNSGGAGSGTISPSNNTATDLGVTSPVYDPAENAQVNDNRTTTKGNEGGLAFDLKPEVF